MKKLIKRIRKYYKSRQSSLFFYPLACLLYESGAKEEAFDLLIEGLAKFPHYTIALIKIAQILIDEEKYEAAEGYLETALSVNNANVLAWELLASIYEKQGKLEEAIKVYEKILILEPSTKIKSKLLSLATVYTPSIEEVTHTILDQNTTQSEITNSIEKQQTQTSDDVIILDVDNSDNSKVSLQNSNTNENTKEYNPLIFENIPTIDLDEDDQLNIAKLYVEQGYIEDAIHVYNEILEKNPTNEEAKRALEALNEKV